MNNFNQKLLLLKSQMFNKKNVLFIIITMFIFIAIILCTMMIYFPTSYVIRDKYHFNKHQTINIFKLTNEHLDFPNINTLKNKDHILYYLDYSYFGTILSIKEFGTDSEIQIYPLLLNDDIKIIKKEQEISSNNAICSINFYPKYVSYEEKIDKKRIYSNKDLLGKEITINNQKFKVTGLFDPKKSMDNLNTCYISKEAYESIIEEKNTGKIIRIDSLENTLKIAQELRQLGYNFTRSNFEAQNYKTYITIPIFISIVVILISFCIIYNFLKKKSIYRLKRYGILKASGYQNQEIKTFEQIENIIIVIITYFISTIIFSILYSKISILLFSTFICEGTISLKVPIIPIIISFIVTLILVLLANSKILNRYLKLDIYTMLRGD